MGRADHGQLVATRETLALLGGEHAHGHLAVPLLKRFTLGTHRLELIASGRGPGAAALHVDIAGRTVLYAGAVRCDPVPALGVHAADVRRCDTLVVHAPHGDRGDEFPKLAGVITQTLAWIAATLAAGRRPVLLVDTVIDGLEIATALARSGYRDLDVGRGLAHALAVVPTEVGPHTAGKAVRPIVWLDVDRARLPRSVRTSAHATALVSGRARTGTHGADVGFAWASACGRKGLLAWIESAAARDVFVTGPCAEAIAQALGPRARVLGPMHQMSLFEGTGT